MKEKYKSRNDYFERKQCVKPGVETERQIKEEKLVGTREGRRGELHLLIKNIKRLRWRKIWVLLKQGEKRQKAGRF